MSSKAYAERFARSLEGTGLCEAVNATFGENRVAVLCRVKPDNEKKWTELLHKILLAADDESSEAHAWQCHFCRNYFLKDRKMVWGWNISVQSKEMSTTLDMIKKVLVGQPLRVVNNKEVSEFPLFGAPADRNAPKGGKGVHTIGNADFHPARSK